ncbi:MAG: hypothetical protein ACYTFM_02110 [Planctomycetota bacterium]
MYGGELLEEKETRCSADGTDDGTWAGGPSGEDTEAEETAHGASEEAENSHELVLEGLDIGGGE